MMKLISLLILVFFVQSQHNFQPYSINERCQLNNEQLQDIIIDSDYDFAEAVGGIEIPGNIKENLRIITVQYYSLDNKLHQGQLVINKELVKDIKYIFNVLKENNFPVKKVIPIVKYNWDDDKSMQDNNTSAFNYRFIAGTKKLSNHSFGEAVDINPLLNPYIRKDLLQPEGAVYNTEAPGTIAENSFIVKEFKKLGWTWGGEWKDRKDYQHFEKKIGRE